MSLYRKPAAPNANSMASKRIKKEIADLSKENLGAMTLAPNESNIFSWHASLPGPAGSPYEDGVFEVDIRIPEDYPYTIATSQVTVPYASTWVDGAAEPSFELLESYLLTRLQLLKSAWSPALSLYKVILSLSSLLTDPNPSDPLVPAIAQEYKRDRKKHDQTARDWVKMYATPKKQTTASTATAAVAGQTNPPSTSSRSRVVPRANVSTSSSSAQPPQIAGTRRSNPFTSTNGTTASTVAINLAEDSDGGDDDTSDIEVIHGISASGVSTDGQARARAGRASKRARMASGIGEAGRSGGTSADDVIIVDE